MKATKAIITALLFLFIVNGYAQNKQEVVVMRVQEQVSMKSTCYIRISYPDETTKTIQLKTAGHKIDEVDADENAKTIQKAINSITNEGYQVVSSSTSQYVDISRTLIIFSRNKKE